MDSLVNIVLVDDNDLDLMIGERLISVVNKDIVVKTFSSGNQVIDWLKSEVRECPNSKIVFFIDIYMPAMNGFEIAEKAVSFLESIGCEAECYLLSATIDQNDLTRIKNHPKIAGFFGKPITTSVLDKVIRVANKV